MKSIPPLELVTTARRRVDVREFPEFAAGALTHSELIPLASLADAAAAWDRTAPIVLICRSGKRATQGAITLESLGFADVAILQGGLEAWRAQSLPIEMLPAPPWTLERQVRATAGAMTLISTLLGLTLSPWFFSWTLFVGGGLLIAAITDTCLMARILGFMPWNRAHAPAVKPNVR